jgi:electron transport complex protein RnfG
MNDAKHAASVHAWPMYRALVGIGMLCGLLIVVFHESTSGVIERKREAALEEAVLAVLPKATRYASFMLTADGNFELAEAGAADRVHAGFDDAGRLIGVGIEADGFGYADVIRLIYGYDPASEAIVGLQVLSSKETPGLGSRIMTDPGFLASFERLDVRLDESAAGLRHPIEVARQAGRTEPWQIDAITGATVSSIAVGDIVNASASRWLPVIRRRIGDLTIGDDDGRD